MEVRDAETGELVVVPLEAPANVVFSPGKRSKHSASTCTLPPLAHSPSAHCSPGRQTPGKPSPLYPETQSMRAMGTSVDWKKAQQARVERADQRFRTSLQGLRAELSRRDLDSESRQALEIQILEKMKAQYAEQVRLMVGEEMERELQREVELRLELSNISKERLRKKHERERSFSKAQIERVRAECEMSLTSCMVQYNLLR